MSLIVNQTPQENGNLEANYLALYFAVIVRAVIDLHEMIRGGESWENSEVKEIIEYVPGALEFIDIDPDIFYMWLAAMRANPKDGLPNWASMRRAYSIAGGG